MEDELRPTVVAEMRMRERERDKTRRVEERVEGLSSGQRSKI